MPLPFFGMPTNPFPLPPTRLIGPVNIPDPILPLRFYISIRSDRVSHPPGFYTLDPLHPSQLILGPFQGKVACQTIAFGRGVCGTAAAEKKAVRVRDVEKFPGHIACDGDSKSEIVVPMVWEGRVSTFV